MYTNMWHRFAPLAGLVAATLVALGCRDAVAPERHGPDVPDLSHGGTHGDLTITTATTGEGIPPGYTLSFSGPTGSGTVTFGANQPQTFTGIAAGDYTLELIDVPANCTVTGDNRRTVTVPAGGSVSTRFDVSCTATTGVATRVTGLGAIGNGLAIPHMDRLEFDFEATSALSGRVVATDYSVVRDDGTPGRIIVDPATDPETRVTSFSQTSATCVRFGGVGRINDNDQLFPFVIDACDNASVGAGADSFAIELPTRPYSNGGTLSEGDIVMSTTEPSPTTGDLTITTATTGEGVPAGYTLSVTRPDGTSTSLTFGPTETRTFPGIAAGDYRLEIPDMPGNCSLVSGTNPRTVRVPAGGSVSTTFDVTCTAAAPTTGTLSITTATTGAIPPGYTVTATGPSFPTGTSAPIGANANVTATVEAGVYTVGLSAVPTNCTVSTAEGPNPREVTVLAGGTGSTTFSVNCTATTPPPVANFTFSCSGLTCSFDASSSTAQATATYIWTWGDGTPSGSGKTATHTYGAADSYPVTLTVTDGGGSSTTTQTVTVSAPNQAPTADFTFSCSGLTCTFTSTSGDPDGTIAAYGWAFGDGTSSTAQNPSHTYTAGGTYPVTLTVTDDKGATGTTSTSVTVTAPNQSPTANFTFSCSGLTCSFTSTSSDPDGTVAAYNWTFGDGGTSTAQNPSHTYGAGGTYTVELTVTDNRGATASASKSVTVSQPNRAPTVNAGSDETVLLGVLYTLNASFSDPDNGPWSYTISWGDGSSTSGTRSSQGTISAGHNYLLIGSYTIKVTVVDSRGASGSDTKVLTVLTNLGGIL